MQLWLLLWRQVCLLLLLLLLVVPGWLSGPEGPVLCLQQRQHLTELRPVAC